MTSNSYTLAANRGDIYYHLALKSDYQRNFDVYYKSLELARAGYQKALTLTRKLGYDFFSQLFQGLVKGVDDRKVLIQKLQSSDQTITTTKLFSPQKPSDVL
jgi:hypothetical protein